MKADLAKLREELCEQPFHTVMFAREDIEELLAIAEAVERAPVVEVTNQEWLERHFMQFGVGQRARLLAIGEDG